MSYNPNIYSNFRGNNCTFQRLPSYPVPPPPPPPPHFVPPPALPPPHYVPPPPHFVPQAPEQYVPPPPQPPPFFIPSATPAAKREKADQDFLSTFENRNPVKEPTQPKVKYPSITEGKELLRQTLLAVVDLQAQEENITDNIRTLTGSEWMAKIRELEVVKAEIERALTLVTGPFLIRLRKSNAKRKAKRLRLKRLNLEKKREKEERIKELKERSRKIDENLQKIKDDINKAKQEEEQKLQADIVLKEVLRKKSDAKKCLTKLEALANLRKARQNTAIGRGETVSESETATFHAHISKLKSLWELKLLIYEKEEADLRAQLKKDSEASNTLQAERETSVASNLAEWREVLFGGKLPQVDFSGDVARFLEVRSQWDQYISSEGTPLPVGWVTPAPMNDAGLLQ